MARVDYFAIEEKIKDVLDADPLMANIHVRVEDDVTFGAGFAPWVGIYLERRDPSPGQQLDAGQSTRYTLRFSIWCWAMSIESISLAIKDRDELVSKVEKVLMGSRSLSDLVHMSWLEGGELPSGRLEGTNGEAVYLSGGEIILIAEVTTDVN